MYYDVSVEISSIPGKTVLLKKKDVTYVQLELGRVYNPKKKYNVPTRKIIGKLANNPAFMHPNDTFFTQFPDYSSDSTEAEPVRSSGLQAGLFLAIRKIAIQDGIIKKLHGQIWPDSGLLMDLAACQVLNEASDVNCYNGYAYKHPLFADRMQVFSDEAVSLSLQDISRQEIAGFLKSWNAGREPKQRILVAFNYADKTHKAGDISLSEKSRQDTDLEFFNTALAYSQADKTPLFYKIYSGSIADARDLDELCSSIQTTIRYKNICFVLDRGDIAPDMLRYIDENGFSFILMAKGCSPLASSELQSCNTLLKKDKDTLIAPNLYGTTVTRKLYDGDKERYVHMYCNTAEADMERMEFEARLDHMSELIRGLVGYAVPVSYPYEEYFALNCDSSGKLIRADKKEEAVRKRLEACGVFFIITSEKMTAADAYYAYKGRDLSENYFRTDKVLPEAERADYSSDKALSGNFFAEFIALIIKSRLWYLLQKRHPKQELTECSPDVMEAVQQLERIEMVRRNDGRYALDSALTKTQKEILLSLGMTMEDVRAEAARISGLLSEAATEIYNIAEEDETFWM